MESSQVKVLQKALNIFNAVDEGGGSQKLKDICQHSSTNNATAYRILLTLISNGWITKNANGEYSISENIKYLFSVAEKKEYLKTVSTKFMIETSEKEKHIMNLYIRENEKCIILNQTDVNNHVNCMPSEGTYIPIYASACGKVLMSELPDVILQEILRSITLSPLTKKTITKKIDLIEELKNVKKKGYALDLHESVDQWSCISVPLRNHENKIIAALSFSGFMGDFKDINFEHYYEVLKNVSEKIRNAM